MWPQEFDLTCRPPDRYTRRTVLPHIPVEVFATVLCSMTEFEQQAQVNDCSVMIMVELLQKKRLLTTECCLVLFAVLSYYAPAGSSPVFEEVMTAATENEQVLVTIESLVSGSEWSWLYSTVVCC